MWSYSPNGVGFRLYLIETEAISHFFTHADIPKGCNPSFIALIPKIPDANEVNDFRPISLIGSIYKIITKILVNRHARVLGDIVNEKKRSLIFKVDFEKAYDSVRWDFLDDVLKKFGFRNKWYDWIQTCLKTSRGSILINGEEFKFCNGLKMNMSKSKIIGVHVEGGMANVIKAIHGEDESKGKAKYAGVRTCWTTIVNEIRILSDQGVNVLEFMRLKLGNGDMASFWNDNWSGGGVLKDLYPRLYALENGKSVNVCTKLSDPCMDYSFRRKTRGGAEQEQLDALMDLVIDEKRLPSVCSKTR
nr:RNA-directed DNA polymerase, eukaryota, reverse transcriptase zinc-binding domain protein [Tanacetum cinerariifolium]